MKTILQLRDGDCRFPLTAEPPHFFCAELTAHEATSYCAKHHRICNVGFGKDPRALEDMIYNIDSSVQRRRPSDEPSNTVAVDVAVKG